MRLELEELEIISGLVQQYKEMPEKKREAARAFAYNRSVWEGNVKHDQAVNKELHTRFLIADAEIRAALISEKDKFEPLTMRETITAVRATVAWIASVIIPVAAFAFGVYITFQALMGFGAAVCAFFTSFGGWLVGAGLVLFCLSALFSGKRGEAVDVEPKIEKRSVNIIVNVDGEQNVTVR